MTTIIPTKTIHSFLRRCKSANTLLWYERVVNAWVQYTEGSLQSATVDQLTDFVLSNQNGAEAKPATVYSRVMVLRSFYRYLFGESHPIAQVRAVKPQPTPQRSLSKSLVRQLLAAFTSSDMDVRDKAILSLMLDTGLRASEVCALDFATYNPDDCLLEAFVKGGKWQYKAFSPVTRDAIQRWLGIRTRIALRSTRTIFCGIGGNTPGGPMTRQGMRYACDRWAGLIGVDKISPHDLRRTFAEMALRNGAPDEIVRRQGGWSSETMLRLYARNLSADAIKPWLPMNKL